MPRKPSSIPENIRKFHPVPCCETKKISGHYYVYTYHSIKLPSGNWGKKIEKYIGYHYSRQGLGWTPSFYMGRNE